MNPAAHPLIAIAPCHVEGCVIELGIETAQCWQYFDTGEKSRCQCCDDCQWTEAPTTVACRLQRGHDGDHAKEPEFKAGIEWHPATAGQLLQPGQMYRVRHSHPAIPLFGQTDHATPALLKLEPHRRKP